MTQAEQGRIGLLVRDLGLAMRRITGKVLEIPKELLPFILAVNEVEHPQQAEQNDETEGKA